MLDQIKQLGAQFGFIRLFLGVMAGTAKKTALQDWLLEQINEDDDDGEKKKYKDLSEEDKQGVDAIVGTFEQLQGIFDEAIGAKAAMCFKFHKALQKAGFTAEESVAIVAAQGVDLLKQGKE